MAEHINKTDTLNEGRVKLNAAISDSNIARGKAEQADVKSTQALANSESTQIQLDTIVIEGDSSVEAAQARVDEKGVPHPTLKARIDDGMNLVNQQLAERTPYVTYEMFREQGLSDSEVIDKTHRYANINKLPVLSLSGEYWLDEPLNTPIETDVNWGETTFHIDESKNNTSDYWFIIKSSKPFFDIQLTSGQKQSFLSKLGTSNVLSELTSYKNHFIVIIDENDLVGARYGEEFLTNEGQSKKDVFYIDEGGRFIGDMSWNFSNYTRLIAYPVEKNYTSIDGGCFYINGVKNPSVTYEYVKGIFNVRRSRTIIKNQWIGLEENSSDLIYHTNSYVGFYDLYRVYDVKFENIKALPRVQERTGNVQPMGTYGFGGAQMMDITLKNVTGVADDDRYWGFMGTNDIKNLYIENCRLKNVDVHFNGRNVYVRDTYIGDRFSVTGGGNLYVDNTVVQGNRFIIFRDDYGSVWDGDINITRSKLRMHLPSSPVRLLNYSPNDFDYKYPVVFGRSIRVEDFTIDYTQAPSNVSDCQLILYPEFSEFSHGGRIEFPDNLEFKNVKVIGREQGTRLLNLPNISGFKLRRKGSFDGKNMKANSIIRFENVDTRAPIVTPQSQTTSLFIDVTSSQNPKDEYSLFPYIEIIDCGDINVNTRSTICDIYIKNCNIIMADFFSRNAITFDNCLVKPNVVNIDSKQAFRFSNDREDTVFLNCTFDVPIVDGLETTNTSTINQLFQTIIIMNDRVRQIHIGTKLSTKLVNAFDDIWLETYEKLQSNNGNTTPTKVLKRSGSFSQRPTDSSTPIGWAYWNNDDNIMMIWDGTLWRDSLGEVIPV